MLSRLAVFGIVGVTFIASAAAIAQAPVPGAQFRQGDVGYTLLDSARSEAHDTVTVTLAVTNLGAEPVHVIWVDPPPSLADDRAGQFWLADISGHDQCSWDAGWFNLRPAECWDRQRDRYTTLMPGQPSIVGLTFAQWQDGRGSATLEGDKAVLTGRLIVARSQDVFDIVSISVPQVPLGRDG